MYFQLSLNKHGMQLLDPVLRVYLALEETSKLLSKVAVSFCIPINDDWAFLLLYILTSIWWCQCFGF